LLDLADAYAELEAFEMARHMLAAASEVQCDPSRLHYSLGKLFYIQREYERATPEFELTLELSPNTFSAAMNLGRCYENIGRTADAADIYIRGLDMRPRTRLADVSSLSDLPPELVAIDLMRLIDEIEDVDEIGDQSQIDFHFAKARVLDKLGRFEEAWSHAEQANRSVFQSCAGKLKGADTHRRDVLDWAGRSKLPAIPGADETMADCPIPLFILGPSRSGKSTIERLLAGLKQVKAGYENHLVPDMVRLASQLSGGLGSDKFDSLSKRAYPVFSRLYAERIMEKAADAAAFTSTSPGLIEHVPRILAAAPRSRFVFVKRNPDDLALRVFMKKYAHGHYYSYSVPQIYEYISFYHALMDIYLDRYPDRTMLVHYENLVIDPRNVLSAVAKFCSIAEETDASPVVGDDIGCAAPYLAFLASARDQQAAGPSVLTRQAL
jgi:hypothetical protein